MVLLKQSISFVFLSEIFQVTQQVTECRTPSKPIIGLETVDEITVYYNVVWYTVLYI